jgi:hypothetical protein
LGDEARLPVLHGAVEVDRRDAEIAAAFGEHLADEAVVGLVLVDGGANPVVIGLRGIGPQVDGELRLDAQQIAPLHGPVVREFVAPEKAIDERAALVGVAVRQELGGLLGGGQRADDVEIDAPEKYRIGAKIRWGNAQALQVGENQLVDFALRGEIGGTVEDRRQQERGDQRGDHPDLL